ncbi:hypothetical protein QJS10_CPA16g01767 [Acorus calamus]|uniref:Protein CHUP1, chloroplastic n=1 Tax=Acorus calamus TaxID=4465 RepID=A0AAV9D2S5_ACOCL|nr:hypothetical protein QJS10_CPA16g01767 [Acorus calamus]
MKQELPIENKSSTTTHTRIRASTAGPKPKPKAPIQDANTTQKTRRSLGPNKARPVEIEAAKRANRRCPETIRGGIDVKVKEMQRRLEESESSVKELRSEIERLKCLNSELEERNRRCSEELVITQMKISVFEKQNQGVSVVVEPKNYFTDAQKLLSDKSNIGLKNAAPDDKRPANIQPTSPAPASKSIETPHKIAKSTPSPPPPPPPPPPQRSTPTKTAEVQKSPALVELYHSLTKRDSKRDSSVNKNSNASSMNNAHSSVVGEFQNRSSHLLAIKADVEMKGDFIRSLIQKIQSATYTDIEDVLTFIDWLDGQLSCLADERAVLKHFNWPERKADAMREAAFEYRNLKRIETEISSYEDDTFVPIEGALKKMESLMDKSDQIIQRLVRLRDSNIFTYKENRIPTEWMLDSGMVSKIKLSSMKLAKTYMKRVSTEIQSIRPSERESMSEALLIQGVRFAYRAHQYFHIFETLSCLMKQGNLKEISGLAEWQEQHGWRGSAFLDNPRICLSTIKA